MHLTDGKISDTYNPRIECGGWDSNPGTPPRPGPQHSAKQRRCILFKANQDVWKIYWQNTSGGTRST